MKLKLIRTAKKPKYTIGHLYRQDKENGQWDTLPNLPNEEWREIDGLQHYMVSNYGRIKSTDRVIMRNGAEAKIKGRIIRQNVGTNGYLYFNSSVNGMAKTVYTHRCVALAFVPNDDKTKDTVDHINNNKRDNRAVNLQWLSQHDNASRWSTGMNPYDKHLAANPRAKRVCCYEGNNLVKIYPCAKLITLELGVNYSWLRHHLQRGNCVIENRQYRYETTA